MTRNQLSLLESVEHKKESVEFIGISAHKEESVAIFGIGSVTWNHLSEKSVAIIGISCV